MDTKDTIIKAHYATFSLTSKCDAKWQDESFQIELKPTTEGIHPKKFEEFVLYFVNSKLHSLQFQSLEKEDFFNLSGVLEYKNKDGKPILEFKTKKNSEFNRFQDSFLKENVTLGAN